MRLNVYAEELLGPSDVTLVHTTADTGREFYGIRFHLKSPDALHHTPEDDDRSAVTFWVPWSAADGHDPEALWEVFDQAGTLLETLRDRITQVPTAS